MILSIVLLLLSTRTTGENSSNRETNNSKTKQQSLSAVNKSTTPMPTFQNTESMYYVSMLQNIREKTHTYCWEFCTDMSGELISIETAIELAELNYHLDPKANKDCEPIWTAGKVNKTTRKWQWPRGGEVFNWCPGYPEPIDPKDDFSYPTYSKRCAAISCSATPGWCLINMHCYNRLSFICEKRSKPYNVNPTNLV